MHTELIKGVDAKPSADDRKRLIDLLIARVETHKSEGLTERAAIRMKAAETGMNPMRVKRLAVLFPEA